MYGKKTVDFIFEMSGYREIFKRCLIDGPFLIKKT